MSFNLHEQVDCPLGQTYPNRDKFGFDNVSNRGWFTCRETATTYLWSPVSQARKYLFYCFEPAYFGGWDAYSQKWHIVRMFDYVESRMGWWDRTRIHDTNNYNAVKVQLSGGWFQNSMAASLALLLLRVGPRFHDHIDFDYLLSLDPYSNATKPSIYRFLDGYQHYCGYDTGWVNAFVNHSYNDASRKLIHRSQVEQLAARIRSQRINLSDSAAWLAACHQFRSAA